MKVDKVDREGFEVLFYRSPQPMWIFDKDTLCILEVNQSAVSRYGYTRHEFLNKSISFLWADNQQVRFNEWLNNQPAHVPDCRHKTCSGEILNTDIHAYKITFRGNGAWIAYAEAGSNKDLTEQLAQTQAQLNVLMKETSLGTCQITGDWNIAEWNTALEKLIGYKREDVIGKRLWTVLPELLHTGFYINSQKARREHAIMEFIEYFWPLQKWFGVYAYPADGGLMIQVRDITHRKLFESALVDKLQQLKQLSFFNSHYIRKPVASLIGITQLIKEDVAAVHEFRELAGYIRECSIELDEMLKRMNKMLHSGNSSRLVNKLAEINIKDFIIKVADTARQKHADTQISVADLPDVMYYGDYNGIQTTLLCLIDLALKLSHTSGQAHITANVVFNNIVIAVHNFEGRINTKQLQDLYEGFNRDKLTNLVNSGLLHAFNIIKKHHGHFWAESIGGEGTVLSINLPLSNVPAYRLHGSTEFSVYQQPQVKLHYKKQSKILCTVWVGFHDTYSVKSHALQIMAAARQSGAKKLLADDSMMLGVWEGAVKWLVYECGPQLEEMGITHIAIVRSLSNFSNISVQQVMMQSKTCIESNLFDTLDEAMKWLEHQP